MIGLTSEDSRLMKFLSRGEASVPIGVVAIHVPIDDRDESEAESRTPREWWGRNADSRDRELWGVTFVIRYSDSRGETSTRRISLREVIQDKGVWYLHAFCHERKRVRVFRLDRVSEIYDLDGVVYAPVSFLRDELGCEIEFAVDRSPINLIRRVAGPGLELLAALSKADGLMAPEEIEVAVDFAAQRLDLDGVAMSEGDRAVLGAHIRRLFPSSERLEAGLRWLRRESKERRRLFVRHAHRLAAVDGVIHPEEFELLVMIEG